MLNYSVVNESKETIAFIMNVLFNFPVISLRRLRKHDMEIEIGEFRCDLIEIIQIEKFTLLSSTVPESHFAIGFHRVEQVKQVRSHGSHTRTTSNVDHF